MTGFLARHKSAALAGCLILLYAALASGIALRKSNTWDEPAHIMAGYAYLNEGMDYLSPLHHPVLGRAIAAALPTLLLDLELDASVDPEGVKGSLFIPQSVKFLYENRASADAILFLARLGNIALGALLGLYIFKWSRLLWGEAGGFLSLFLYALSPTMLAHSSLATTDLPVAAFFFMSGYYLYRSAAEGACLKRTAAAAVLFALALASKHSALLLAPFAAAAYLMAARRSGARAALGHLALFALVSYLALWAVYGFKFHCAAPGYVQPDWGAFAASPLRPLFEFARQAALVPESYLYGVAGSFASSGHGKAAFFMGQYSLEGWWNYFAVAFLIKTPIPTLILLAATLLYMARDRAALARALPVLLPALALFLFFSLLKVNIGLRHLLPMYPFLFTLLGFAPSIRTESARLARAVFYTCLVWYAYSASLVYPHQMAYFNAIAGGPGGGYRWLVDSNLDWGQDLKELKRYMDSKGIDRIKLAYFGLSDPAYFGIDYEYMPSYLIPEPRGAKPEIELEGWFAVSATMLQGVYLPDRQFYSIFKELKPIDKVGYSIFIYRIERAQ